MFKRGTGGVSTGGSVLGNKMKAAGVYILAVVFILAAFLTQYAMTSKYKQDITVAVLKEDVGGGVLLKEEMLKSKTIALRDFNDETMVPMTSAKEQLLGKYTKNMIPANVELNPAWFTKDQLQRYRYLREMTQDEAFVTLPYDSRLGGGKLIRPGDHITLRAVYHEADPQTGRVNKKAEVDTVFEDIVVVDMLNSNQESILNIIEDAERLPADKREEVLKSKEFSASMAPKYLGFILKKEQAKALHEFNGNERIVFKVDLLTRNRPQGEKDIVTGNVLLQYLSKGANAPSAGDTMNMENSAGDQ